MRLRKKLPPRSIKRMIHPILPMQPHEKLQVDVDQTESDATVILVLRCASAATVRRACKETQAATPCTSLRCHERRPDWDLCRTLRHPNPSCDVVGGHRSRLAGPPARPLTQRQPQLPVQGDRGRGCGCAVWASPGIGGAWSAIQLAEECTGPPQHGGAGSLSGLPTAAFSWVPALLSASTHRFVPTSSAAADVCLLPLSPTSSAISLFRIFPPFPPPCTPTLPSNRHGAQDGARVGYQLGHWPGPLRAAVPSRLHHLRVGPLPLQGRRLEGGGRGGRRRRPPPLH